MIVVLGLIGGLLSQILRPEKPNDLYNFVRAIIIGGIASYMMSLISPVNEISCIVYGLAGDQIILNIVGLYNSKMNGGGTDAEY